MKNTDVTKSVERGSGFEVFGLSEETLLAIEKKGYTQPTEIQKLVLPVALGTDKDIIAQAQTGTGKTAAFAIPILERIDFKVDKSIKALIVTPTRELALQIYEEIKSLRGNRKIKVATVYGGQSMERQLKDLAKGVDIVVGTPGRLLDHINRKTLDLSNVKYLVLDEADRMLDMGFLDDVLEIIKQTPETKRTFLFSATMPKEIVSIARKFMKDYEHISTVKEELTTENAEQIYFEVEEGDKLPLLCRIIDMNPEFYGIVFCQTKAEVDEIAKKLSDLGYNADGLHGDYSQSQRERVLDKFRKKQLNVLVTTDVAARGIDIEGLTHVINYSVPRDPEYYVHRIGRTGRAGKKGLAITFVTRSDYYHSEAVEMLLHTLLKEKIDITRYGNIKVKDFSKHSENNSTVRLFVALGSSKGLDKKRLVEYISEKTGIEPKNINNVRVFETYSFIDVNEADADIIMRTLNKTTGRSRKYSKSSKPLVQKAREKKSN
jgi:ATP-dependent RNA helicase DeaD